MVEVPLANGRGTALIDGADAAVVQRHSWWLCNGYARSSSGGYLHRLLMQPGAGMEVDHENGNELDCRRGNLRVVTHAQNQQNRHRQSGRRSRYRGVTWYASRGNWMVRCKVAGVEHFGGYFADEDEAGAAARTLRARVMPFATG